MIRRRPNFQSLTARRLLAAVDIPDDLTAAPAATVSVPVNIDDATGVRGAEIRLEFDPDLLELNQDDVTAGEIWDGASDTQVTVNIDQATGSVVIFVSASAAITSGEGSLVELNFSVADTATIGDTSDLDLTSVVLNEGQVAVSPAPISGSDQTDGVLTITNGGTDSISGFVFADANGNGELDSGEAIGGVTIVLTNTGTDQQFETVTDADGSYSFTDLAAGSYTVAQQQPVAYQDGGNNVLSVTLATGDAIEDQNFVEVGLLPQYVYTRLMTTLVMPVGSTSWSNEIERITTAANSGAAITAPPATTATSMSGVASTEFSTSETQIAESQSSEDAEMSAMTTAETGGLQSVMTAEAEIVFAPPVDVIDEVLVLPEPIETVADQSPPIDVTPVVTTNVMAEDPTTEPVSGAVVEADEDREEAIDQVHTSELW
ncbi:cohesin domain-containing protein [Roseiconus lacunae]|uniref:Cohesin domain-containing protein n=1 Tax=Roseiconus lacunae TaxID=2605694 RepID=A0ABT7PRQ6_9BACT|nr:cohesin domain-containing protein [Roseiconus lacunae]MDM4019172.1 cohesin domain-containing protein [Roseiconus lacunae]